MSETFYYIVVDVGSQKYFVNRDMDFTDNFETVLPFEQYENAEDFIEQHKLLEKNPKILKVE